MHSNFLKSVEKKRQNKNHKTTGVYMRFWEYLVVLRMRSGLSASEAAKLIGITSQHLYSCEHGGPLSPKRFQAVALAYGVDVEQIITQFGEDKKMWAREKAGLAGAAS